MSALNSVVLRTNEYSGKKVNQIELHYYDMRFYKDITCDRDIKLAARMAADNGLELLDYRAEKENESIATG